MTKQHFKLSRKHTLEPFFKTYQPHHRIRIIVVAIKANGNYNSYILTISTYI